VVLDYWAKVTAYEVRAEMRRTDGCSVYLYMYLCICKEKEKK
jgi:hypothetical protein